MIILSYIFLGPLITWRVCAKHDVVNTFSKPKLIFSQPYFSVSFVCRGELMAVAHQGMRVCARAYACPCGNIRLRRLVGLRNRSYGRKKVECPCSSAYSLNEM